MICKLATKAISNVWNNKLRNCWLQLKTTLNACKIHLAWMGTTTDSLKVVTTKNVLTMVWGFSNINPNANYAINWATCPKLFLSIFKLTFQQIVLPPLKAKKKMVNGLSWLTQHDHRSFRSFNPFQIWWYRWSGDWWRIRFAYISHWVIIFYLSKSYFPFERYSLCSHN